MKNFFKLLTIFFVLLAGLIMFALSNQIGGWRAFIVSSASMEPTIATGSLILSHYEHPSMLQKNDIITFIAPTKNREFITHRITKITNNEKLTTFKTKGDKNKQDDNWTLAGGGVVGKVRYIIPLLGYLFSFSQTKLGILLFILLPAGYVILDELRVILLLLTDHKKKHEKPLQTLGILFFFLTLSIFLPQQSYALLSDNAELTNNTFSVLSNSPTPFPACGGNINITIKDNGAGSHNSIEIKRICQTIINQTNTMIIINNVKSK